MKKAIIITIALLFLWVGYDFFQKYNNANKILNKDSVDNKINPSAQLSEKKINTNTLNTNTLHVKEQLSISNNQKVSPPIEVQQPMYEQTYCYATSSLDKNILSNLSNVLDQVKVDKYVISSKNKPIYYIFWGLSQEENIAKNIILEMKKNGLFTNKEINLILFKDYWSINMAHYEEESKAVKEINLLKGGSKEFGGLWFLHKENNSTYYLEFKTNNINLENYIFKTFPKLTINKKVC